jgi:haloalkane dehalogenase
MKRIEDGLEALVDKPALIVWGLKDPAFRRPMLHRWARCFNRVDGPHLLPHAAHYLQEDAPQDILSQVERWAPAVAG